MGEPKPIASLSSGLLARKGQAKPAMRPQGFGGFGMGGMNGHQAHEDLGWNDMGHDHLAPVVPHPANGAGIPESVEPPAVVRQHEELARELTPPARVEPQVAEPEIAELEIDEPEIAEPEIAAAPRAARAPARPRAAPGSKGKAAFTLRLDPERHLQLRLACAMTHRSAQQVVTAALDAFLENQPGVADMVKRRS